MEPATIPWHKTAIRRGDFSRPVKCLLRDGLLDDSAGIGTRDGWARRLAERGFALKGHRVVRCNGLPASPAS
jgi:hypothetical protein